MPINLDSILRKNGKLVRARSFSELGIDLADYMPTGDKKARLLKSIREYRESFTKMLRSEFREPTLKRTDASSPIIDIESAYAGINECFYRNARKKRMPIQIGVNLSGSAGSESRTYAARIAAVMAVIELCKLRGQQTEITVVYGNTGGGVTSSGSGVNHFRIRLSRGMSQDALLALGNSRLRVPIWKYQERKGWQVTCSYHIYKVEKYAKEFDFCLDRIELSYEQELDRIWKALRRFRDN